MIIDNLMGKHKFKSRLLKKIQLNFDSGLNRLNSNWIDVIEFPIMKQIIQYKYIYY